MQSKTLILIAAISVLALVGFLVERSIRSAGACESAPSAAVASAPETSATVEPSPDGHSCELPTAERTARIKQFGEFAAKHLERIQTNVVANFVGEKDRIGPILRQVIAAEADCCSFLQFEIEESSNGYRVTMSTDGSGNTEVADMLRLMTPQAR